LSTRVFDGLVNFRDLGGLSATPDGSEANTADGGADGVSRERTIAFGRLFRSDALSYGTPADADHLVNVLGVATVVDLRETREVADFGRGPLGERGVSYIEVPIGDVPTATTRSEFYVGVLATYGPAIADLLKALVAPGAMPAVIHCHVGCDRTGAVSAAILLLLGVDEGTVAEDYARSRRANDVIRQRARDRRQALGLPQMDDAYYAAWDPRAEIMLDSIKLLRERWGGIDGWAAEMGLTEADIAALRAALLV
jgi:protein-tyrosine phosphatase